MRRVSDVLKVIRYYLLGEFVDESALSLFCLSRLAGLVNKYWLFIDTPRSGE